MSLLEGGIIDHNEEGCKLQYLKSDSFSISSNRMKECFGSGHNQLPLSVFKQAGST